jgi:selT/selW/selH-like putative selenoprotein
LGSTDPEDRHGNQHRILRALKLPARGRQAGGRGLIKGDDGIFDVRVDGELIYSKHETGRFPEPEEILSDLRRR